MGEGQGGRGSDRWVRGCPQGQVTDTWIIGEEGSRALGIRKWQKIPDNSLYSRYIFPTM